MKRKYLISISLVLFGFIVLSSFSFAEETDNNSITIIKYKLTEELLKTTKFPIDGNELAEVSGPNGEKLEPMSDISYTIERVTLDNNQAGFRKVEGLNAFKAQIKTDKSGTASISSLKQGMYRVTENDSEFLANVMEPLILELPLPRPTGNSLKEIYLYPKSSVATVVPPVIKPVEEGEKDGKLPQTSGNVGSYFPIVWTIAFAISMGLIGFYYIFKSKNIV